MEEVKNMRKLMHKQEGFTLIELMIVILIIAILVAIAVPVFLSARTNAQKRTCQANLRTIDGAINTYNAQYDYYPGPSTVAAAMVPTMLKKNPSCPTSNTGYNLVGGDTATQQYVSCPTTVAGHSI